MSSPEALKPTGEHSVEASEAAGEQLKKLHEQLEKKTESPDQGAERAAARKNIEGLFSKEAGKERRSGGEPSASGLAHATKRQRQDSYTKTMKQIQSEMGAPARTFSKVIHNKTVERTSDVVGSSVARPNAVLAGSVAATFLTLFVFLVAKQYGYRLSGFETIGTFFVGWALGLLYDYARLLFSAKRT